ncbi:diacylglycerol acyltransferase-domain-containing protein [Hyaloraphidium curvatum]|nr:diacylglycerol acyltransferase-domain-containing protein [Hyaloraphidium curvatum]
MSDEQDRKGGDAPAEPSSQGEHEVPVESVVEAVHDAIAAHSAEVKELAQSLDSDAKDVAAAAGEIVGELNESGAASAESGQGKSVGDEEPTPNAGDASHARKPSLATSPSLLLTSVAENVARAAGSAAKTVESAASEVAKKLKLDSLEPVEWAPLSIPMERRRQTLAVALWALVAPISWFLCIYCVLLTSYTSIRILFLLYCVWIYIDEAPFRGARPLRWVRHSSLAKWFVDYYPVQTIKTVDLDPNENYLFGYHPHGVLGFGAWATFATAMTGFEESFPGITPHLCTLNVNFRTPFGREWLLAHGVISADKKSILNTWKKGKGQSVTLVIGGAEEASVAKPGTFDLVLNKRLGFVKLALSQGVSIVPCFAFGENELFEVITNPTVDKVERLNLFPGLGCPHGALPLPQISNFFKKTFGFTTPLIHGRGIFTYNYGILPRRRPIHVVVGKPIATPKTENPSDELVRQYHKQYQDGLKEIFDEWKERLSPKRRQSLRFIK